MSGGRRALEHRLSAPRATKKTLGLPHAAAWAAALDELLGHRMEAVGERFAPFRPFDPRTDYYRHLRGRPRLDGIHAFLASRGIRLPEGRPNDPPGAETIHGLANRKDEALLERPHREGVHAFTGSLLYLEGLGEAGSRLQWSRRAPIRRRSSSAPASSRRRPRSWTGTPREPGGSGPSRLPTPCSPPAARSGSGRSVAPDLSALFRR